MEYYRLNQRQLLGRFPLARIAAPLFRERPMLDTLILVGAILLGSILVASVWARDAFDLDDYCPYCDDYAPFPCQACGRINGKETQ